MTRVKKAWRAREGGYWVYIGYSVEKLDFQKISSFSTTGQNSACLPCNPIETERVMVTVTVTVGLHA